SSDVCSSDLRHVLAFFQGNRYLLRDLAAHVAAQVSPNVALFDLYAGAGLFAIAAAVERSARVTAVEGDRYSAGDLVANAAQAGGGGVGAPPPPVGAVVARPRPPPPAPPRAFDPPPD